MYAVTRQMYWPDGDEIVEIADGGLDYTNPDALVATYPGEMQEYQDPCEALDAAIEIARRWRADGGNPKIAAGHTLGFTMPFEPSTEPELREWCKRARETMPKCARCGDILPDAAYENEDSQYTEDKFCSEYCAEEAYLDGEEPCGKCQAITLRRQLEETYTGYVCCPACAEKAA